MGTRLIVIGSVTSKNTPRMRLPKMMIWSKHSRRSVPMKRSAIPFCHG